MARSLFRALFPAAVLLCSMAPLQAQEDPPAAPARDAPGAPLRWLNLEDTVRILSGPAPVFHRSADFHVVRFDPGVPVTVQVPAGEMLRIVSPEKEIPSPEPEISISNGSGLWAGLPGGLRSGDDRSLLIPPDGPAPYLVRIRNPSHAEAPVDLGLFLSRRTPIPRARDDRNPLPLSSEPVRLSEEDRSGFRRFWRILPGTPLTVRVRGPSRLIIENRLIYEPEDGQKERSYRIFIRGEEIPESVFLFETRPDAEPIHAGDRDGNALQVLGRLKRTVLEIPDGSHPLRIASTAMVYGRIFSRSASDYLLPGWNAPAEKGRTAGYGSPATGVSFWADQGEQGIWERALRLARDNTHRDGGLVAAMLLKQAARDLPSDPGLHGLASEMLVNHTFRRDLVPDAPARRGTPWRFFHYPAFVPRETAAAPPIVVAREQLFDWLAALPSGVFTEIPGRDRPLVYSLPPRSAPSILRIAVHPPEMGMSSVASFCLRMDDRPPVRFSLDPSSRLPEERRRPLAGAAGLRALEQLTGEGTMGGIFSTRNRPGPLVPAGHLDIPLPPETRRLRLWRVDGGAAPLYGALRYRASGAHRLTEPEYRSAVSMLGPDSSPVRLFLRALRSPEKADKAKDSAPLPEGRLAREDIARKDLVNHWHPLIREIRRRAETFTVSLEQPVWGKGDPLAPALTERIHGRARSLAARGEWLPALEDWGRLAWGAADARVRADARMGVVRMLYRLKEFYLAEHLLRGMLLFETDGDLEARAFRFLEARYRSAEDSEGLIGLYAFALGRGGDAGGMAGALAGLAGIYAEQGEAEKARTLWLLEEQDGHDPVPLLRSALSTGWWRTFEETLARLDPRSRDRFRGMASLRKGDPAGAKTFFRRAGARKWLGHIREGERIRGRLNAFDPRVKLDAARKWMRWFSRYPGHRIFKNADHLVERSAGAKLLYSTSRDLYSRSYLATPADPITVRAAGPACLRVEARPVHAPGGEEAAQDGSPVLLDGWMEISAGASKRLYSIHRNRPSPDLRIIGDVRVPGRRVIAEFPLGPGIRKIVIQCDRFPLLVRVHSLEPEIPTGILPPPAPATLAAKGLFPETVAEAGEAPPERRADSEGKEAGPRGSCSDPEPEALRQRIAPWVKAAGEGSGNRAGAIARAHRLIRENPPDSRLAPLINRLQGEAGWIPLDTVRGSAGVRRVPVTGWAPQSPALRVRKALLQPMAPGEQMLTQGHLILSIRALAPARLDLLLRLETVGHMAPFPMSVRYELDDGPPETLSLNRHTPMRRLSVSVPAGDHFLRLGIVDRVENQFVRVRLEEEERWRGGIRPRFLTRDRERTYLVATQETPVQYLVEGPARVRVDEWRDGLLLPRYYDIAQGWRTLEVRPESNREYGLFRAFQRLPVTGEASPAPRIIRLEPRRVPPPPVVLFPETERTAPPGPVHFTDRFRLGGQEDGTWTVAGGLRRKKNFQEEQAGADEYAEISAGYRYFDDLAKTYFHTRVFGRFRGDAGPTLGVEEEIDRRAGTLPFHLRLQGRGFLQWIETLRHRGPGPVIFDDPTPYAPDGSTSGAIQGGDGRVEGALHLGITGFRSFSVDQETRHVPHVTLFGRFMTIDESHGYPEAEIDPDIHTPYKADHRYGLRIGETLTHSPWLDTRWVAGGSVTWNETFDPVSPDHLTLRVAWKQLAGPFRVDVSHRFQRYFEDDDRSEAYFRNALGLGLSWEGWVGGRRRIEGGLDLAWEMETGEIAGGIVFSWDWGQGRGYRDYPPGEVDFSGSRNHAIPRTNNAISGRP